VKTLFYSTIALLPYYRVLEINIGGIGVSLIDILIIIGSTSLVSAKIKHANFFKYTAILLTVCVVSAIANGFKSYSTVFIISLQIKFALLFWGFLTIKTQGDIILSIKILLISSIPSLLLGIFEQMSSFMHTGSAISISSTYGARNEMLSMVIPLSMINLYFLLGESNKGSRIYYFIFILQFTVIFLSRGRLGILVAVLFWLYLLIQAKSDFKNILKSISFIGLCLGVVYIVAGDHLDSFITRYGVSSISEFEDERGSTYTRLLIFNGLLSAWQENPLFGLGPAGFLHKSDVYVQVPYYDFVQPHSTFLGILAEIGIIGFAATVAMLMKPLISLNNNIFRSDHSLVIYRFIVVAYISQLIILFGFDGFLRYPLWIFLLLVMCARHVNNRHSKLTINGFLTK
jgi:O-antigen ligase